MKKWLLGLIFASLLVMPVTAQLVSAEDQHIGIRDEVDSITVSTEYMTVRILPSQAHLIWWYGNVSSADEMYKLQLLKIQEFTGDDAILDDKSELGGISYSLISDSWSYAIVQTAQELTITMTLTGLANGATIQLVMHVYTTDVPINGTDQTVDALTELKFDIIIENWVFSPTAAGIAIESFLTEVQNRHRVRVRNGTLNENGNATRTMQFISDKYDDQAVAYFEWNTFAHVYNSTGDLVDTVDVGTSYFADMISPPPGMGFEEVQDHLWLTYPNYENNMKLIHDPTIGLNADLLASSVPLYVIPLVGGLAGIAIVSAVILKKKRA